MNKPALCLVGLVMAAGLTFAPPQAAACSCAEPPPLAEDRERQTAIFAGEVVEIEAEVGGKMRSSADPMRVAFEVDASWKGVRTKQVIVRTAVSGASCGYEDFEVGREYIVFATGPLERLETGLCTRTAPLESSAALTAELGPALEIVEPAGAGRASVPSRPSAGEQPANAGGSRWGIFAALAGGALLSAAVAWAVGRRKKV
ncbi:hypothetical protein [Paenibacillus sp.]|uniref:hypothetical protein n=1 Tax=Paenibacillus sp. TaxID=58172 RepID=UPI002D2A4AFB|nr:hypothetical protein [Paenibacillus sp.]HZG83425.1 hypothetical protein [Paenibacillus sp.]